MNKFYRWKVKNITITIRKTIDNKSTSHFCRDLSHELNGIKLFIAVFAIVVLCMLLIYHPWIHFLEYDKLIYIVLDTTPSFSIWRPTERGRNKKSRAVSTNLNSRVNVFCLLFQSKHLHLMLSAFLSFFVISFFIQNLGFIAIYF